MLPGTSNQNRVSLDLKKKNLLWRHSILRFLTLIIISGVTGDGLKVFEEYGATASGKGI